MDADIAIKEKTEVRGEEAFSHILSQIQPLNDKFQEQLMEGKPATDEMRVVVKQAKALGVRLRSSYRFLSDDNDQILAQYNNAAHELANIRCQALDCIPFAELSLAERDEYIEMLATVSGVQFRGSVPYYLFGKPTVVIEIPQEYRWLREIGSNSDFQLTPEQESALYDYERNTLKVHLQVPYDRRITTLKTILQTLAGDNAPTGQKKASRVTEWKMLDFEAISPAYPIFVFYTPEDTEAVSACGDLASEILTIVKPLGLPACSPPRFSTPVISRSQGPIPYLSWVQGNGDFKEYLRRSGGEEKLGRFYDPARNYAARPGTVLTVA